MKHHHLNKKKSTTAKAVPCMLLWLAMLFCFGASAAEQGALPYKEQLAQWDGLPRQEESIVIAAKDYSAADMVELDLLPDGTLYTGEQGYVEYTVTVPRDALYTIAINYFPGNGSGGDMQRSVSVNGEIPFKEAKDLFFSRMWNNKNDDYKTATGNQPFPSQVQTPEWMEVMLRDAEGYVVEPFLFYFKTGENTLRITSLTEGMILDTITLSAEQKLISYAEYLQNALDSGAAYADVEYVKIQAEDAALKSGPSFYPMNDRTSPLTEPYHPTYITLNCIGDTAWNEPGEWIAWDIEAPVDGLYRIVLRFKQSDLRGMYATRTLRVNGVIPFQEASDLRFYYDSAFQISALKMNRTMPNNTKEQTEEFWFYLKAGVNRITLEVSLGALGNILSDIDEITSDLNSLYRDIIAITGTAPDIYANYQLYRRIPHLRSSLESYKERLSDILTRLTALTGSSSERTAGLTRLLAMMDDLLRDEEQVVRRLAAFKECITAIGKSALDLKDQPFKIDYIILAGKDMPKLQADGNIFQMAGHTLSSFFGSFYNDYNVVDSALEAEDTKTIDVWLSTGRDQFDVIRRLINESFESENGIKVNLRLINADVLLPSTFTGRGPDVAIQISNVAPVNFAFRGAAYDLTQFEDYEEVSQSFLPAALESFYYLDGCYALPDQMSFPVLFYRKDIFNQLGLTVPETWDDLVKLIPLLQRYNMEIYLDTNPPNFMGAYISMGNSVTVNTVFLSRLYQTGGDIYSEDGTLCLFDTEVANTAFKWWTQFYTQYGFPREIDFITRFRLGEVPIGIVDLSTYTRLMVSAPEIRGDWGIAMVPGTLQADGKTIARDVPCVTGAAMIIRNTVEQKNTEEAAWEFLKWWTGSETQGKFALEMEAILGRAGRYLVANLDAFKATSWELETKAVLMEMLPTLHGIPQVPGGYITGRYLNNAFVTVITDYENPADTLFEATELINKEIDTKRREFGLPVAQ